MYHLGGFGSFIFFLTLFNKNMLQALELFPNNVSLLTNFYIIASFVFRYLTQLVRFSNIFGCAIVVGGIQRFFVFVYQLVCI